MAWTQHGWKALMPLLLLLLLSEVTRRIEVLEKVVDVYDPALFLATTRCFLNHGIVFTNYPTQKQLRQWLTIIMIIINWRGVCFNWIYIKISSNLYLSYLPSYSLSSFVWFILEALFALPRKFHGCFGQPWWPILSSFHFWTSNYWCVSGAVLRMDDFFHVNFAFSGE